MKKITSIWLAFLMFVAIAIIPTASLAQNTQGQGGGTTGTTTNTAAQTNDGFNLWWLLPLVALPLLYLAFRNSNNERSSHHTTMVGAKGGRSSTSDEFDEEK